MKLILLFLLLSTAVNAENVCHIFFQNQDVHTVFFSLKDSVLTDPFLELGSGQKLRLQFDELDVDNSRNLYYSFIHCNYQWKPSDLLDMDYCTEFNKFFDADKATFSFNTTVDYVHYEIEIDTSPLKISGNYLVCIFDVNTEEMILCRPFMLYEKRQVDIKYNLSKSAGLQTISVLLDPITLKIKDATEIKIAMWKNHDYFDYRIITQVSRIQGNNFIYDAISFPGGNEYRWFDNSDLKRNGTHVHDVLFEEPFYHITLEDDEKRPRTYKFHGDMNGRHYVKTQNSTYDPAIGADYTITHFTLKSPENIGDVYIAGDLTENLYTNYNKMDYDAFFHCYRQAIWVKQGIHNYCYKTENNTIEGDFSDTENIYNLAVYYCPFGSRYDRLLLIEKIESNGRRNDFF